MCHGPQAKYQQASENNYNAAQREFVQSFREPVTPESRLAKLMSRDLKVTVTDRELRLFIKAHWSKISALAHQIHDEEITMPCKPKPRPSKPKPKTTR